MRAGWRASPSSLSPRHTSCAAGYTNDASFWDFAIPLLVNGIATGTFFVSTITLSLDGIPPERIPSASGIANFSRITAGSFAASIATTMWDQREALHQNRLAALRCRKNQYHRPAQVP